LTRLRSAGEKPHHQSDAKAKTDPLPTKLVPFGEQLNSNFDSLSIGLVSRVCDRFTIRRRSHGFTDRSARGDGRERKTSQLSRTCIVSGFDVVKRNPNMMTQSCSGFADRREIHPPKNAKNLFHHSGLAQTTARDSNSLAHARDLGIVKL
jgi:hypothetical protein